jgi:hypothetical protein
MSEPRRTAAGLRAAWRRPRLSRRHNATCHAAHPAVHGQRRYRVAIRAPWTHAALVLLALGVLAGAAQAGWHEPLDSEQPSWRPAAADVVYRLQAQERTEQAPHSAPRCELLQFHGGNGTHVWFSHPVPPAVVVDELHVALWVRAPRPGVQLLARVVLPRSIDPHSGQPVTLVVRGDVYSQPGQWQQLHLRQVPLRVQREARLLRAAAPRVIDTREAYIDQVVVNAYCGPGLSTVWLDDLSIDGFVPRAAIQPQTRDVLLAGGTDTDRAAAPRGFAELGPAAEALESAPRVQRHGSLLLVGGEPFFPRAIEHRGEPLAFLKGLGFNAVQLRAFPSPELLAEARQCGMWIVAPPPPAPPSGAVPRIGPHFDWVLAWDLGENLTEDQLEWHRHWAHQIRASDSRPGRPLLCDCLTGTDQYSRIVDILRPSQSPLGTSLELADYAQWLRTRPRLARPGTPLWTTIATQPSVALWQQVQALAPGDAAHLEIDVEQLRLVVYAAVSSGVRGLCFASRSRLDAPDDASRRRAMALELMNHELSLVEPWVAAGSLAASASAHHEHIRAAVLHTQRAHLLLPLWLQPGSQCVPGQSAGHQITFTVPGIPETSDAYELTPGGLRRLPRKRVAGGMLVTLEEFGLTSLVLLTDNARVLGDLAQRLAAIRARTARLQRELSMASYVAAQRSTSWIDASPASAQESVRLLQAARAALAQCDAALQAGNDEAAYLHARRALRGVRMVQRAAWEQLLAPLASPAASPLTLHPATLLSHQQQMSLWLRAAWAPNHLPGGDCENLQRMLDSGWRNYQHAQGDIQTRADLAAASPHTGNYCLRLQAWATSELASQSVLESPPLWVTTAPIELRAGQVVRIHGWARIDRPIAGSTDGLMIFDSAAGPALALRISDAKQWDQWRPFTMYRVMPADGRLSVTFALTGLGEVSIDDVTIEPLAAPATGAVVPLPPLPLR